MVVLPVVFLLLVLAAYMAVGFLRWLANAKPRMKLAFGTLAFVALPVAPWYYKVPVALASTVVLAKGWGRTRPRVLRMARSRAWA